MSGIQKVHGASVMAIFEMADGSVYNYRGSWCPEGMNTSWECDWRVVGVKGSAIWDGWEKIQYDITEKSDSLMWSGEVKDVNLGEEIDFGGHAGVINEFLESLKRGAAPQTECHDNIKSLKMVLTAAESAETGKKVRI